MTILRNTKVSPDLQAELVSYGILRDDVREQASKTKGRGAKLVGVVETPDEFKLYQLNSLSGASSVPKEATLSIVAPDHEAFDMLEPKDFSSEIKKKDEKSLRAFLIKILDSIHL